jgi:two-component system, NarL family, response regulator DevR
VTTADGWNDVAGGPSGYLLKQIRRTDLVEAIRTVAAGGSLLDPAVTQRVLERIRSGASGSRRNSAPSPRRSGGFSSWSRRA